MQPHEYFHSVSVHANPLSRIDFLCNVGSAPSNVAASHVLHHTRRFCYVGTLLECDPCYWYAYSDAICVLSVNNERIVESPARALLNPFNIPRHEQMRLLNATHCSLNLVSIPPATHIDLSVRWRDSKVLPPHTIKAVLVGFVLN